MQFTLSIVFRNLPLIAPSRSRIIWKWQQCTINRCYRRDGSNSGAKSVFFFCKREARVGGRRWRCDNAGRAANHRIPLSRAPRSLYTLPTLIEAGAISAQPFQTRRPLERNYATRASGRPYAHELRGLEPTSVKGNLFSPPRFHLPQWSRGGDNGPVRKLVHSSSRVSTRFTTTRTA